MNEQTNIPNNSEIDQALKEFEVKNNAEQIQKTLEVSSTPEMPKMVQLVMKWSGVKEQIQAEYVILGLVVLMFVASFYLFWGGGSKTTSIPIDINKIDQSKFVQ